MKKTLNRIEHPIKIEILQQQKNEGENKKMIRLQQLKENELKLNEQVESQLCLTV